jgi:thiamine pyrophosphate-dependent acetolactate synthase large subunit-like protein
VFHSFLEKTKIPVFNSRKFSSPLPIDHPQRAGLASLLFALRALGNPEPDLVILLGCRTGMFLGSRSRGAIPSPDDARYIQIDLDGSEIGRSQHIDVGIVSDAQLAVAALDAEASRNPYKTPESWTQLALSLQSLPSPHENESVEQEGGRMHPYHALKATFQSLEPGSIVSTDGGECGGWAASTTDLARPFMYFASTGYLGFLGNGWGYSLGASVAAPDRRIISIHGDGSAGFHLAELDTYARFGCKVLTVVVNNHAWGMSIHGQDEVYGEKIASRPISQLSPLMDFAAAARALSVDARKVTRVEDIKDAVHALSESDAPGLLELVVSKKPTWPGTLAMVGNTDDPNVIVVPVSTHISESFLVTVLCTDNKPCSIMITCRDRFTNDASKV